MLLRYGAGNVLWCRHITTVYGIQSQSMRVLKKGKGCSWVLEMRRALQTICTCAYSDTRYTHTRPEPSREELCHTPSGGAAF